MDFEEFEAEKYKTNILTEYWNEAVSFISSYGWYLLGLSLLFVYLRPYIEDALDKFERKREEKKFEAKLKKNPNLIEVQNQEIERARRKMQEEHDRKAAEYLAKMKEKEEKKRQELLSQGGGGNRLGDNSETSTTTTTTSAAKKKSWKPEYNPLMGNDITSRYRPPRRSGCPGGGCG